MIQNAARALALAVAGLAVGSSAGCMSTLGTLLTEHRQPYAGVTLAADVMRDPFRASHTFQAGDGLGIALVGLDLVPSAALDTVLLPITLPSMMTPRSPAPARTSSR